MSSQTGFGDLPPDAHGTFHPFEVHVSDTELEDLKTLLRLSKLPPPIYENSLPDRRLGVQLEWMKHAVDFWSNSFDWYASSSSDGCLKSRLANSYFCKGANMKITSTHSRTISQRSKTMMERHTTSISWHCSRRRRTRCPFSCCMVGRVRLITSVA